MKNSILAAVLSASLVSTSTLAQEAEASDAPVAEEISGAQGKPKNAITVNPTLWMFFGAVVPGGAVGLSFQYERALTNSVSVYAAPGFDYFPFFMPELALGARYYVSGQALHGFSLGGNLTTKILPSAAGTAALIQPSVGINYQGLCDSGFTMNVGIGVGYTVATGGGVGIPLGLTVPFHFGLGWMF